MKSLSAMSFALLVSVCLNAAAFAGDSNKCRQELARSNYFASLSSPHDGIRNSAIFMLMQYRLRYPDDDYAPFAKRLREMSLNDPYPKNRLYAFIVWTLLENTDMMKTAAAPPRSEDAKDAYFAQLHELIQNHQVLAQK